MWSAAAPSQSVAGYISVRKARHMAKKDTNVTEIKPKRKQLTPAERVAKIEAELRAAREKLEAKSKKQIEQLLEKRKTLLARAEKIDAQVNEIDNQLEDLGYTEDDDDHVAVGTDETQVG